MGGGFGEKENDGGKGGRDGGWGWLQNTPFAAPFPLFLFKKKSHFHVFFLVFCIRAPLAVPPILYPLIYPKLGFFLLDPERGLVRGLKERYGFGVLVDKREEEGNNKYGIFSPIWRLFRALFIIL